MPETMKPTEAEHIQGGSQDESIDKPKEHNPVGVGPIHAEDGGLVADEMVAVADRIASKYGKRVPSSVEKMI